MGLLPIMLFKTIASLIIHELPYFDHKLFYETLNYSIMKTYSNSASNKQTFLKFKSCCWGQFM